MPPSIARLRFELASTLSRLEEVVERSEAFLHEHLDDDEQIYRVVLVVSEAVTNAIRHGNAEDERKKVRVDVHVREHEVEVVVEDEGEGFDRGGLSDPRDERNLLREGGRGIYLIEEMTDAVAFEERGRRVRMRFER